MTTMEQNVAFLSSLWEQYHENTDAFNNLSISGNYLVFEGKKVDISNFSINYLFVYGVLNKDNINNLSSEDIFRLVRLYALTQDQLLNINEDENKKQNNEEELEIAKQELPILKRINIVTRYVKGIPVEYINIVDENGYDHMYINDRNFKINTLYDVAKANQNINANDLVSIMNTKLPNVDLSIAGKIIDNSKTSEGYLNKISNIDKKYKDDKTKCVLGNEEHDIIIVSDKTNPLAHQIITFKVDEYGNVIYENHERDLNNQEDTNNNLENNDIKMKQKEDEIIYLIPSSEFYNLINSDIEFNEEQRKQVNYYYEYLEDLIKYKDYLTEDLSQILTSFTVYINGIMTKQENGEELTQHQQEILNKYYEWLEKSKSKDNQQNALENVQKLTLKYKVNNNYEQEKAGFTETAQVILFVLAFATILTAVTLYILK